MRDYFSANRYFFYTLSIIALFLLFYFFFLSAPADFPVGGVVKIEQGKSLRGVSLQLKEEHIIRSRRAFEAFVILFGRERVIATNYYFENKLPVYEIARRVSKGEHHIVQTKVTIPEGLNNSEIADIFEPKLTFFNRDIFLKSSIEKQGSLFPDTYYFFVTDTEIEAIDSMIKNFEKKIAPVRPEFVKEGKTERQIITMASILEKESEGDLDRSIISGILWRRIRIGMPLQVDVALETYKSKGLPANPIGNPGMEAIKAALYPQESPYLYYLHDKDGNIHYAKTFAEHKVNKSKYLGN